MRHDAGIVAFHAAFAVPGMALLYALGLVRRLRDIPAAIGPAYVAGVAAVMSVLMLLLVSGVGIRLPQLAAVAAAFTLVIAAAGFLLARRRPADPEPPRPAAGRLERAITWAAIAALGLFFAIGASAFAKAPVVGDDWTIWSYKAIAFFKFDGLLQPEVFTGIAPGPAHIHYPVLQPLLESLFFRAVGEEQLQEWHAVLWIFFGAFVWTIGWLVRSRGFTLLVLLAPVAALALTRKTHDLIEVGYADVTVACFAAAGALSVGLWLSDGGARYALLGAIFLAGAANTKNEGLLAAVVVFAVAAGVLLATRRARVAWRPWLASAAIVGAAAAPWMIWRSSKDIESQDVKGIGEVIELGLLTDRFERIPKAFTALFDQLAFQDHWFWLVPSLLVFAIVCVVQGTARREAAFYLAVPVVLVLGLVFVYWTGNLEIGYWLGFSADRTVTSVVLVCGVGLVHLIALVADTIGPVRGPPGAEPAGAERRSL